GWQTIVVHVVDPRELAPAVFARNTGSGTQPADLIDLESGEKLRVTPTVEGVERYQAAGNGWMAQIEAICEAEHADYLRLQTDWPFQSVVVNLLHRRGVVA